MIPYISENSMVSFVLDLNCNNSLWKWFWTFSLLIKIVCLRKFIPSFHMDCHQYANKHHHNQGCCHRAISIFVVILCWHLITFFNSCYLRTGWLVVSKMVFRIKFSKHLFCYSSTASSNKLRQEECYFEVLFVFFFFCVFRPISYFINVEPVVLDPI